MTFLIIPIIFTVTSIINIVLNMIDHFHYVEKKKAEKNVIITVLISIFIFVIVACAFRNIDRLIKYMLLLISVVSIIAVLIISYVKNLGDNYE